MSNQNYLVIRPVAENPALLEPYLGPLADTTGLDQRTLRQRLIGSGLRVLKVNHDRASLEEMSSELKKHGLLSAVIGKNELVGLKRPLRSSNLEIVPKSLTFFKADSENILSLDGSQNCLMVLATMDFKGLQGKRLARLAMNAASTPLPLSEVLFYIFRNQPVLDLYLPGADRPIRIDSTKFNYNCLGEANPKSAALNFPAIMKKISHFCSCVVMDTGFGENELPFLNWSEKSDRASLLREFTLYSAAVFLAYQRQIFSVSSTEATDIPLDIITIEDMEGLIWAGPLLSSKSQPQQAEVKSSTATKAPLPPAMQEAAVYNRHDPTLDLIAGLKNFLEGKQKWIKTLGPPLFLYPLTALILISLGLSSALKSPKPLSLGFLCLGLILFIQAFVLLQRKKTIENCPTSKIRSMPMGQVEIKGYARQKYYLKSPHTLTDCVYYSYKVYETVWNRDEQREILREWGNSGSIPFYIEDETGKALVLPNEAIVHAGSTQTMLGDPLSKIFGAGSRGHSNHKKIVETIIPVGQFLYAIGFARRLKISSEEKKKKLIEKLRVLKSDPDRLKRYDLNQDGEISQQEWDMARKDMEEEALLEELSSGAAKDTVAIGEHPSGGLFYLSDKREERILRSMSWKIPLFLSLGLGSISGAAFYLLKFFQNKAFLLALKGLLWP